MITKRTWVLILILLVVIIITAVVSLGRSNNKIAESPTPLPTATLVPAAKKSSNPPAPAVYTKVVAQYEGRRMQFDAGCQAIPNNVTYKNGTEIMLDNRSGDARYIVVGGVSHYVQGYGYKIITLSSSQLPKNLLVSCGAAVNVAQILLQK